MARDARCGDVAAHRARHRRPARSRSSAPSLRRSHAGAMLSPTSPSRHGRGRNSIAAVVRTALDDGTTRRGRRRRPPPPCARRGVRLDLRRRGRRDQRVRAYWECEGGARDRRRRVFAPSAIGNELFTWVTRPCRAIPSLVPAGRRVQDAMRKRNAVAHTRRRARRATRSPIGLGEVPSRILAGRFASEGDAAARRGPRSTAGRWPAWRPRGVCAGRSPPSASARVGPWPHALVRLEALARRRERPLARARASCGAPAA